MRVSGSPASTACDCGCSVTVGFSPVVLRRDGSVCVCVCSVEGGGGERERGVTIHSNFKHNRSGIWPMYIFR